MLTLAGCGGDTSNREGVAQASSCMTCHNGSPELNDYSGPGIEDPHPFGSAAGLACVACHGGNPNGADKEASHIPPPPQIGDRDNLDNNTHAYFNRLTLTGIDRFPDYTVDGVTYTALDYLQFINPGDLRVTSTANGCGQCHGNHAEAVADSMLATATGIFSGAMFAAGAENQIPAHQDLYEDTAADLGFRAATDSSVDGSTVGAVGSLIEFPVFSVRNANGANDIDGNPIYNSLDLPSQVNPDGTVVSNSPLANLYHEQVAFTCGDCHLGSAGANNRAGDFRSSGCTACHMQYSLGGRSGSGDPNIDPNEPLNPDNIRDPELPHVGRHLIRSVAKTLPSGEMVPGIDDYACAGCHQGSNRTVMQFWGIRLDQNQDVRRGVQYPANPVSYQNTNGDTRLFDPAVGNNTFNGRNRNQYLVFEDYDGDGKDDTPADVHHEAGMGCIDCHGSYDLHGDDTSSGNSQILSRMEQGVAISCESCHGTIYDYAPTQAGTTYAGVSAQVALDEKGNRLRHVWINPDGDYILTSRLTGEDHYIPQTKDVVVDNGRLHPDSGDPIYSAAASYAMGKNDGDASTGIGPQQVSGAHTDFAHGDSMSCASCHSSWTNNCIGCHLEGEYDRNNNFSNITGERIVFEERFADFVYQSPVPFQLGVGPDNKISPISPNTEVFFRYLDEQDRRSDVVAFSDRNGKGNNRLDSDFPSLSHNMMMPHSIRGKVDDDNEGPRYCVACHLTEEGVDDFGEQNYIDFRAAMEADNFAALDFDQLQDHIGRNPGNRLNSPLWVHMVAGLGSGLFLFDENGCPINPLDQDDERKGCEDAPANNFNLANVAFNLDRIVNQAGIPQGSNNHAMMDGQASGMRDGDPRMSGPLGRVLIEKLTDPILGIKLSAWYDADGLPQGDAQSILDDN